MIEDDKKRGDSGIILNIWLTETASGRLVSSRTIERMYVVVSTFKRTSSFKINPGMGKVSRHRGQAVENFRNQSASSFSRRARERLIDRDIYRSSKIYIDELIRQ